ncbi:universal stress protein UspA [Halobellus salinus]|uniref:Universal stress protein UspA n=1 Tax=Halobellus salinus TaxID=931585 RepID=A0A830E977_9EURY|nr:universal stress protein [Halobellus salinus]GGJ02754.1 universal stress protein UspA [Halobellus salinus]SMP16642.1 Nucleotide-binding universal stress protein, UspA family [Halobellus salinus]
MSYDKILIPTDGSGQAGNAVEEGINLATELDATVHALHVVDEFEAKVVPITGEEEAKRDEYVAYGERITDEVADLATEAGLDAAATVEIGIAHKKIQQYVEDHGVDLVVIGSRGLGMIEEALLGSTADKVIRLVDEPVTVVYKRPGERTQWMLPSAEDTIHR